MPSLRLGAIALQPSVDVLADETKNVFRRLLLSTEARDRCLLPSLRSGAIALQPSVDVLADETKNVFRRLLLSTEARDRCLLPSHDPRSLDLSVPVP